MPTTIYLVDDHPIVREGVRLILETQPDFSIVGEAGSGEEAVSQVARLRPDFVTMDITMPGLNGIEATRQIVAGPVPAHVIILSIHATTRHVTWAFEAGAKAYLLKGAVSTEIVTAIRMVQNGRCYLSPTLSRLVGSRWIDEVNHFNNYDPLAQLSPREREVLTLVLEGKTSGQIAGTLAVSSKTIDTYRARLMQKLNVDDMAGLIKFAIRAGLTPLE